MNNTSATYWQLINYYTGKCLYPENYATVNNAAISQKTCDPNSHWQQWILVERCHSCDGHDYYMFMNRETAKCINNRSSSEKGTVMLQATCGAVDENYHDLFTWIPGDV